MSHGCDTIAAFISYTVLTGHTEYLLVEFVDEAHFLEGFDTSTPTRGFSVRLVALTTKLYRRTRLMVGSRIQIRQVC